MKYDAEENVQEKAEKKITKAGIRLQNVPVVRALWTSHRDRKPGVFAGAAVFNRRENQCVYQMEHITCR